MLMKNTANIPKWYVYVLFNLYLTFNDFASGLVGLLGFIRANMKWYLSVNRVINRVIRVIRVSRVNIKC